MEPVIAAGLFSLVGVVIGALLSPLTQLFIESKRDKRMAKRAKALVAQEMLQAQLVLRSISAGTRWPPIEDADAYLPTSAWRENKSFLVGEIDGDLLDNLTMAYALLEADRQRFLAFAKGPPNTPLEPREAQGIKNASDDLGRLRRQLAGGSAWPDEIHSQFKPQLKRLNDDFRRTLDGLNVEDLKKDAVIAKVKDAAHALGELNRNLGDNGAWAAEIDAEINRRSRKAPS